MYSPKMIYKKRDLLGDSFPVSYSVLHSPDPAYGSGFIIAFAGGSTSQEVI